MSKEIRLLVSAAKVLTGKNGPDSIMLDLQMPSPYPNMNYIGTARIDCQAEYEHVCPGCKKRIVFTVPRKMLSGKLAGITKLNYIWSNRGEK